MVKRWSGRLKPGWFGFIGAIDLCGIEWQCEWAAGRKPVCYSLEYHSSSSFDLLMLIRVSRGTDVHTLCSDGRLPATHLVRKRTIQYGACVASLPDTTATGRGCMKPVLMGKLMEEPDPRTNGVCTVSVCWWNIQYDGQLHHSGWSNALWSGNRTLIGFKWILFLSHWWGYICYVVTDTVQIVFPDFLFREHVSPEVLEWLTSSVLKKGNL